MPKGKLSKELKYLKIFNEIKQEIVSGQIQPGAQLLGFREIMEHYTASYSTISKTLNELEKHGLITRRQGQGIFVAPRSTWQVQEADANFIGVIVTDMNIPFFSRIIRTIENEITSLKFHMVVRNSNFDSGRERQIIQEFIGQRFKGILLVPTFDEEDSDFLHTTDGKVIPLVYINRHKWNYECSYVVPDDYTGACDVMRYLFELGHRDIGYFSGERIRGRDLRYKGYEESLKLNDLQVNADWVLHGEHFEIESGCWCMNQLMSRKKLPTAIFCYSDNIAAGAMKACQDKGITIPEDVSFVGCNDDEICRVIEPNLTTLADPIEIICTLAVKTLLELIKDFPSERQPLQLKVPMRLIRRQSVRHL